MENKKQTMDRKTSHTMITLFKRHFKCDCKRCLSQIKVIDKFIMPNEDINWNCSNCSGTFKVICDANNQGDTRINIFEKNRGYITKLIIENPNNDNKWKIVENE